MSEIDGGVYVKRVYECKRISVNKGKKTRKQKIHIENKNSIPLNTEYNIPVFLQNN